MAWQDDEIKKRLQIQEEQTIHQNVRGERIAFQKKEIRKFLDKIVEANNLLDPILRTNNISNVNNWEFQPDYPCNRSPHVRYDINDRSLYFVQRKEIRYTWGLGDVKRYDSEHYKITEENKNKIIDIILRNMCTNRAVTDGLPRYVMTIKGDDNYTEIIESNYK